ncbi:hypothetical protein QTP86_023744, partial [Hemibagrus guttatus]
MDALSKFFFSLEQKNGQKRFIHAVRTESGDLLSEPTEIRKQTVSFYSKLYSSEWSGAQVVEDSFFVGLQKLSERAARELDRELSLEELHEALQRMENGRVSGIDGLPAEFYKAFWAVIGQDVLDVLRDSIWRGGLAWKRGGFKYLGVYLGTNEFFFLGRFCRAREGQTEQVEVTGPKDVLQGANAGYQQPRCVVPLAQAGMRRSTAEPASEHPGPVDGFLLGQSTLDSTDLHLPKEEGGQGLVQLSSRAAAFRLQFIQRLLTGPRDLVWRAAASGLLRTVKGLGLDRALFLMDTKMLDISGLPMFYRGLFKIWNVFKKQNKGCRTVHWLLEEPLVYGGRLDISGVTVPALSRTLISSGIVTLWELVNVAGSYLSLTSEERVQLKDCQRTETGPAEDEPFPQLNIAPDLDECAGPLLECRSEGEMDF